MMKRWEKASNYVGTNFSDYFVLLSRHRDSDVLTNCNFEVALEQLGGESDNDGVIVEHAGHWAVGWVESILIHKDSPMVKLGNDIKKRLDDYPVLDDSAFSDAEEQERNDTWDSCDDSMISDVIRSMELTDDVKECLRDSERFNELVRLAYWEDCFGRGNDDAWIGTIENMLDRLGGDPAYSMSADELEFCLQLKELSHD